MKTILLIWNLGGSCASSRDILSSGLMKLKSNTRNEIWYRLKKKSDSDDVACFDGHSTSGDPNVYYVHAFASPGWADHDAVANFSACFAAAENESAVYKSGQRT